MKQYIWRTAQAHRKEIPKRRVEIIGLQGGSMDKGRSQLIFLVYVILIVGTVGCQQETPTGEAGTQNNQPAGVVEQAAQQAINSINTPMDKARGVEGTLEKSAEQTAEKVKEATQ
jgi:hypothetical protein